jgi:hypothetical protein
MVFHREAARARVSVAPKAKKGDISAQERRGRKGRGRDGSLSPFPFVLFSHLG